MSRTVEEMAAEFDAAKSGVVIDSAIEEMEDQEMEDQEVDDQEVDDAETDDTPGFKSYEDYVKDGGDPDMYKGKKAYIAEHERIAEIRRLKTDLREVKDMTKVTMESLGDWKTQQTEQIRKQLEAQLEDQRDRADVDGALETKEKLAALEKKSDRPKQLNPVLVEYMESNPIIDKNSDQFNKEFFDDMARIQAVNINRLSDSGGNDLTPAQILKCTKAAFEAAKELNKELFVSRRNERPGQTRKTSTQEVKTTPESRLKNYKVKDFGNGENTNAANEVYEMLKKRDPKAAATFAKNLLGE